MPDPQVKTYNVLVVDDSPTMRRMVMTSLRGLGEVKFTEAGSGLEAIERVAVAPVDLMILDLNMPEMGGRDALAKLQQLNPAVKAVILSGGVQLGHNGDCGQPVRYLQKPFANDELVRVVGEMLSPS